MTNETREGRCRRAELPIARSGRRGHGSAITATPTSLFGSQHGHLHAKLCARTCSGRSRCPNAPPPAPSRPGRTGRKLDQPGPGSQRLHQHAGWAKSSPSWFDYTAEFAHCLRHEHFALQPSAILFQQPLVAAPCSGEAGHPPSDCAPGYSRGAGSGHPRVLLVVKAPSAGANSRPVCQHAGRLSTSPVAAACNVSGQASACRPTVIGQWRRRRPHDAPRRCSGCIASILHGSTTRVVLHGSPPSRCHNAHALCPRNPRLRRTSGMSQQVSCFQMRFCRHASYTASPPRRIPEHFSPPLVLGPGG